MRGRGKIRYVLTSGNTGQGLCSFIPGLLEGMDQVLVIEGAPGTGKSTFIRDLGEVFYQQGYMVELWISAIEPLSPEGLYLPQLQTAVIVGHPDLEFTLRKIKHKRADFGVFLDETGINMTRTEIENLIAIGERHNLEASTVLAAAVKVRDELVQKTVQCIDKKYIDELLNELEGKIFENKERERHYFATAVTAEGLINYLEEISVDCSARYIFTGPDGSGKSMLISRLAGKARKKDYSVTYYHCGFNPDHIIMVYIEEIKVALIDAGYIDINRRPGDAVIDMSDYLNEDYQPVLDIYNNEVRRNFEQLLLEAGDKMEKSSKIMRKIKRNNCGAMDFTGLKKLKEELLDHLIPHD